MLKGESQFHIGTPLGIEPGSLMTGRKWIVHWTSETWYECCEIAGSLRCSCFFFIEMFTKKSSLWADLCGFVRFNLNFNGTVSVEGDELKVTKLDVVKFLVVFTISFRLIFFVHI
jgi:hypothetical protein